MDCFTQTSQTQETILINAQCQTSQDNIHEQEQQQKQQLEEQQLEKQQLEKQQLEKQQLEKQQLEKQQLEKQQLEKQQLEKQQLEKQQLEKQQLEKQQQQIPANFLTITELNKFFENLKTEIYTKMIPDIKKELITELRKVIKEEIGKKILVEEESKKNEIIISKIVSRISEYSENLDDLMIESIDFELESKNFAHSFLTNFQKSELGVTTSKRLISEFKSLYKQLPTGPTNPIFLRYDTKRMDVMTAMIAGADGTPYSSGLFMFDIFFPDNYPNSPPLMNIVTTGGGKLRFNPNLYADGLVCLSILGTWEGDDKVDEWHADTSNLLRVLLSIQSIVMTDEILYNEPDYDHYKENSSGTKLNNGYSNIVRYGTIKYGMTENIRNPPKGYEKVVNKHFFYKKKEIIEQCEKWVEMAKNENAVDVAYNDLVFEHNMDLCKKFEQEKGYLIALEEAVKELKEELVKIQI